MTHDLDQAQRALRAVAQAQRATAAALDALADLVGCSPDAAPRTDAALSVGAKVDSTPLLTVAGAARHAGVSPATVREWISRGKLRASKAGNRWRICRADLDRAMAPTVESVDADGEAARILRLDSQRR